MRGNAPPVMQPKPVPSPENAEGRKGGELMAKRHEIRAHPDIQIIGTPHPERGIAYLLEGLIKKETGAEVRVEYIGDKRSDHIA